MITSKEAKEKDSFSVTKQASYAFKKENLEKKKKYIKIFQLFFLKSIAIILKKRAKRNFK